MTKKLRKLTILFVFNLLSISPIWAIGPQERIYIPMKSNQLFELDIPAACKDINDRTDNKMNNTYQRIGPGHPKYGNTRTYKASGDPYRKQAMSIVGKFMGAMRHRPAKLFGNLDRPFSGAYLTNEGSNRSEPTSGIAVSSVDTSDSFRSSRSKGTTSGTRHVKSKDEKQKRDQIVLEKIKAPKKSKSFDTMFDESSKVAAQILEDLDLSGFNID